MPYIVLDPSAAEAAPVTTLGDPLVSSGETLASMRGEMVGQLGNRVDLFEGGNGRVHLYLNQSYIDLATSLKLDELQGSIALDLVAGQSMYMLPSWIIFTTLGTVFVDSSHPLGGRPIEKIDFHRYRSLSVLDGEPQQYFRYGNMIVFYPTPEAAGSVVLDFRLRPRLLTDDTHSPILGYEWHEVILLGAKQRAFSAMLEFDKAMIAQNEVTNLVRRKMDIAAEETDGMIVGSAVPRAHAHLLRDYRIGRRLDL